MALRQAEHRQVWRDRQMMCVVDGTLVDVLARASHPGWPSFDRARDELLTEFEAIGTADRGAMTKAAERRYNRRTFEQAVMTVTGRWGANAADMAAIMARFDVRDRAWNQQLADLHPGEAM
jgi:hypothetical protein